MLELAGVGRRAEDEDADEDDRKRWHGRDLDAESALMRAREGASERDILFLVFRA